MITPKQKRKKQDHKARKRAACYQGKVCRIAEKMMQAYLAKTGGTSNQPKQVSYRDVVLGSNLTPEQMELARSLIKAYEDIFMKSPDDIPPPLKVEPVEWQLKQGAQPVRCRRPNWDLRSGHSSSIGRRKRSSKG